MLLQAKVQTQFSALRDAVCFGEHSHTPRRQSFDYADYRFWTLGCKQKIPQSGKWGDLERCSWYSMFCSMIHNLLRCDKCKYFRFSFLATLPLPRMHFLKQFPPCSDRPRISTSHQRLPLLTWRSHSSNSFPNLTGADTGCPKKNRPRQGKAVKIQAEINWSREIRPKVKRAKLIVWNSSSFWPPPPCAVCKNRNVCHHSTPHKVDRTFKLEKYSKHDSLGDGEKLIEIERVKMWEAPWLPSCDRFVRNLCASANKHNVFHVLSSARKRAHSGAIFSPRLPRFSREPFSYFLSFIPGKITILPVCAARWRLLERGGEKRRKVDFLLYWTSFSSFLI